MLSTLELFHTNEWKDDRQNSMNLHEGVYNVIGSMESIRGLFKILKNFSIQEFDELCHMICPTSSYTHNLQVTFVSY